MRPAARRSARARAPASCAGGAQVAADALVHQRVGRIEHDLHGLLAIALLALGDVGLGETQIVDDVVGLGPELELVVVLEEVVVAVGRVRHHQRLHGHGVLLHDVADAGVGVDDELVGQAAHAALVVGLVAAKRLPNDQCRYISGMPIEE